MQTFLNAEPVWADIMPGFADKLGPLTDPLVQDVLGEIRRAVPAYAGPPSGELPDVLVDAFTSAIQHGLGQIHAPHSELARAQLTHWKAAFRNAGRVEFVEGRTADPLQTAIRVGARVVWRHISTEGPSIGITSQSLLEMAEAIFTGVDELSAAAVEGYREAQAEARAKATDAREQARYRLTRAILSPEPAAAEWVHALADAAACPLPDRLVVIAVERRGDQDRLRDVTERPDALVDLDDTPSCILFADTAGNRRLVADLVGGRRAAVGPAVAPAEANRSAALARRLLGLQQANAVPATGTAWCQDHLATLLLIADPLLNAQLREHIDDAFADLTPRQRDRMAATLLVWLQTRGTHNDIAERLDVHPQTVRYRIHQLQQLLGDKLADPDARLTLELALRARMLLNPQT